MSTRDAKNSKEFFLEIINLYASLKVAGKVTWYVAPTGGKITAREIVGQLTGSMVWNVVADLMPLNIESAAITIIDDGVISIGRNIMEKFSKSPTTLQKTIKEVCNYSIISRKDIEGKMKSKIWHYIPSGILSREKTIDIIERLMTYKGVNMEIFQKIVPVQLYNIFFRIERLIKVNAGLDKEDERKLMTKHRELMKKVLIDTSYDKLFRPRESELKILALPTVLSKMVVDYTSLSCFDESDVDLIFGGIIDRIIGDDYSS